MLYRFHSKKGNIIVILIGLISVMLLMVAALSRRMTGHTQLLTLSDYTQISRYFLESYMADVMQQIRCSANESDSKFSSLFSNKINNDTDISCEQEIKYEKSSFLADLAKELDITCDFKPKITLKEMEKMGYPNGILAGGNSEGKERRGFLELVCKCSFQKREYKLVVQYPFKVVFRMTPILKDFMLFVTDMNEEQRYKDEINVISFDDNGIVDEFGNKDNETKPFFLMPGLDNRPETNGRIYLGPSDDAVFLNLAGGDHDNSFYSDTHLVSAQDLGCHEDKRLDVTPVFDKKNGYPVSLPGFSIKLVHRDSAKLGIMGFSTKFSEVFNNNNNAWKLEDFLGEGAGSTDYYWDKLKNSGDLFKAMSKASALKIMGYNTRNPDYKINRHVFGNVFARFAVISFWQPHSAQGKPLKYDRDRTDTDNITSLDLTGEEVRIFECDEDYDYQVFHSRIVSGKNWQKGNKYNNLPEKEKKLYMPMNVDFERRSHRCFDESDFEPEDGFRVRGMAFDRFGSVWYKQVPAGEDNSEELLKTFEGRICRTFRNQEEFEKACVHKKGSVIEKLDVNGVVYVKGDLNLGEMNLGRGKCSGGVIIVDGDITLDNIYRGEKFSANSISFSNMLPEYFDKWNYGDGESANGFIPQSEMLTFVSLNGNTITMEGNVFLGVHLINLKGEDNPIQWKTRDKIIFFGAMACKKLDLENRLDEFKRTYGKPTDRDPFDGPFFLYPKEFSIEKTSLAVQIMENMRSYELTASAIKVN